MIVRVLRALADIAPLQELSLEIPPPQFSPDNPQVVLNLFNHPTFVFPALTALSLNWPVELEIDLRAFFTRHNQLSNLSYEGPPFKTVCNLSGANVFPDLHTFRGSFLDVDYFATFWDLISLREVTMLRLSSMSIDQDLCCILNRLPHLERLTVEEQRDYSFGFFAGNAPALLAARNLTYLDIVLINEVFVDQQPPRFQTVSLFLL